MSASAIRVSSGWLSLREPADAAARSLDLARRLGREQPASGPWVIHDLGCGTGAMGRWLAPRLSGSQHWVLNDRDAELLEIAMAQPPGPGADGAPVTVEANHSDITDLRPDDLIGATLITASALLDLLTEPELAALLAICVSAVCPMLVTLSVVGQVELTPPDDMDRRVTAAFNAHQRRVTERGRLLGPDAVAVAVEHCRQLGAEVVVRPSPWRLCASHARLAAEWFTRWVGAACEQDLELAADAESYARRRLAQAAAGELAVTVEHADMLISPH